MTNQKTMDNDPEHQIADRTVNNTVNTTSRSGERTCTQNLIIPILDKYDVTSVKLWWRRVIQNVKMTKEIDSAEMTTNREILHDYRDLLEQEVKDIIIWAVGQTAVTEMTKTAPTSLPLWKLYGSFRLHFTPERSVHHSRAVFFEVKRHTGESAADVWKRILEVEKNCEFETVTAAEILASKFLSII